MSHGGEQGSSAEPNLVPLLDLVLQLLMFFMICINFASEQSTEIIKLPESFSAKPMSKEGIDTILLNVQPFYSEEQSKQKKYRPEEMTKFREGEAMVTALLQPPFKLAEANAFLKSKYEDAARLSKDGQVRTVIIVRAHKDTQYKDVYRLLQMGKNIGYRDMHLRAMIASGGPK